MKRVEVHDGWFGLLIQEGPIHSLVRVTECDEPLLVGKEIIFINHELTHLPLTEEEKDMATVAELTKKYNEIATSHGLPQIKKFKDKTTAERRLADAEEAAQQGKTNAEEFFNKVKKTVPAVSSDSKESGKLSKDVVKEEWPFKKAKKGNAREDLKNKLESHLNQMMSKKQLGDLAAVKDGLVWFIANKKFKDGTKISTKYEVKEEEKDGQQFFGLFEK